MKLNLPPAMVCFFFFCSGFAALTFEIVWCRTLLRIFGAGAYGNACVFAGFMAGSFLGALISCRNPQLLLKLGRFASGRQAPAIEDNQAYLRAYGRLELIAGLFGLFLTAILTESSFIQSAALILGEFSTNAWLSDAFRFLLCFLFLLLPCFCMGAGFPALAGAFAASKQSKWTCFPVFYGTNTLGASLATMLVSFVLLPQLGLYLSAVVAAALNLLVFAILEISLLRGSNDNEITLAGASIPNEPCQESVKFVLLLSCVFLSGFLSLLLELAWTRVFSLVLGGAVYSLAAVLLMVLLGTGCGALLTGFLKREKAVLIIGFMFLMTALSTLLSAYFQKLFFSIFLAVSSSIANVLSVDSFSIAVFSRLILAFVFIFFPALFLGSILPLAASAAGGRKEQSSSSLYAFNCLGALLASSLFLPVVYPLVSKVSGYVILHTLLLVAFSSILAAVIYFFCLKQIAGTLVWRFSSLFCCAGVLFLVSAKPPHWDAGVLSSGFLVYENRVELLSSLSKLNLIHYFEGINSTLSVFSNSSQNCISLRSDGKVEATLPLDRSIISPGSDLSTHILLGGLPVLFHEGRSKRALLIGLGSGVTAASLLSFSELDELVVSELEATVLSVCRSLSQFNDAPIANKNPLRFRMQDARFVLSSSKEKYDIIVSQPADPWVSGSSDLYTQEFWRLAAGRLNERGIFCQWLQLYAIPQQELLSVLKTFASAFDSVYICHAPGAGELILLGSKQTNNNALLDLERNLPQVSERIVKSANKSIFLASAGVQQPYDAYSLVIAGPDQVKKLLQEEAVNLQFNTDNKSRAEYATCRSLLSSNSELQANFKLLVESLLSHEPYLPAFSQDSRIELARALLRQIAQEGAGFKSINERRASLLLDGDKSSAAQLWTKALLLFLLGQTQEAELVKEQASKASAASDLDKLALFDIEFERGKLEASNHYFESLSGQGKLSFDGLLRKGLLLLRQGRPAESIDLLSKLLDKYPGRSAAWHALSYAALANGDSTLAFKSMHKYLCINPWDYSAQLTYTNLLCKTRDLGQAFLHASCATELNKTSPDPLILVLDGALNSADAELTGKVLNLLASRSDRESRLIVKLSGSEVRTLLGNESYKRIVKRARLRAEDPKNGYMILGEP